MTTALIDVLMSAELDMSLRHSNKKARDNKENNNSNSLWKNKPFLVGITSGMIAVTVFTSILICYFAFQLYVIHVALSYLLKRKSRRTRKKNKQRHKVVDNNSSHQRSDAVNDFDHQLSCPSINNINNVNIHNNNNIITNSIISSNNIFPNQAEIKPLIKPGMNNDQQKYYKHHSLSRSQQSHNHIHHPHDVVFEETSLAFNKFSTNQHEMSFVKQHPSKTLMSSKNIYNPPTNNNFNNSNNNNYNNNYSYSSGCQTLRSTNTLPLYSPQQKFHQNYHQQQTHEQHQNKQQQQQPQCYQQNSNTQQQTSKQQQIATIFPTQYVANTKNNNIANSLCFQHSAFSSAASTATSAATAATTSNATKSVTWSPVLDQLLMMPHEDSSFSDETTAINNFNNSAILQPNKIQLTFCNNNRKSNTLNRYNNNNSNTNNTLFKDIYSDFSYDPYSRDNNNNNTTLCTSSNKDNNTSLINDPYPNANADSLSSSLTSLLNNQSDDTCRLTPVLEDASNVVVDRCSAFEPVAVRAKNKTLLTDV
ncbi:hypothetical protein HELRODRAFT_159336 [Helobdella robusta]|uniref:Uncharacterized protein n=1 Tax=Helobdella robusta TaxID=6412 RepID=T1ENW7_HELRO|nr:hypothetical protein HELRODRAFT_159336 [Helobdella robusta]ESO12753.1 hypothetical protein HELRODRAFT_159336 [Helobdella robusta]